MVEPEPEDRGAEDRCREGQQSRLSPSSIASTAWPTSQGISTVMPIASQAKTREPQSCPPVGAKEAEQSPVSSSIRIELYKVK